MTSAPWPLGSLETRVEISPQTFNTDSIFGGGGVALNWINLYCIM